MQLLLNLNLFLEIIYVKLRVFLKNIRHPHAMFQEHLAAVMDLVVVVLRVL